MAQYTLDELEDRYKTLTARIVAIDIDIGRETDSERRKTLTDRRVDLAMEREKVAADIGVLHPNYPFAVGAPASMLDHRVTALERDVKALRAMWQDFIKPDARAIVSRAVFFGLLLVTWSMWMVKEIRDWLIVHPGQAIAMTLALVLTALIIRWWPEGDAHDP